MSDDYDVGYQKPPKAHQFKKGEPSANPEGRPKGRIKQGLLEQLNKKIPVGVKNGRRVMMPVGEVINHNLIKGALEGDRLSRQILFRFLADEAKAAAPPRLSAKQRSLIDHEPVTVEQARRELVEFFSMEMAPPIEEARNLAVIEVANGVPVVAKWVYQAVADERERQGLPPLSIGDTSPK